ncbi:MAG: hypothetical protein WD046_12545 [Paracoccaceae bacterium]
MSDFSVGDIVVLTAGSPRMNVEAIEGTKVSTVWCHEGQIGRDAFDTKLLKKWEMREDGGQRGGFGGGGGKPYRGDREGGARKFDDRPRDDRPRDDKPRGKTGWDGKPRENKFFRKD